MVDARSTPSMGTLRTPESRTCERCGRKERWDDDEEVWKIVEEDGELQSGVHYCIHEWDITGSFTPITEA